MRSFTLLLASLVAGASLSHAQELGLASPYSLHGPHVSVLAGVRRSVSRGSSGSAAQTAFSPNVILLANCPTGANACGYVPVPLDRKHPQGTRINIYFEQYLHSNAGLPAVSAIMGNYGGPGFSTTASRGFFQFAFAANMDVHDLLLVDDRGRGQSGAIGCNELQHGGATFATAEADCAVQLGAAASRYGSGDIAEDMNDVREALGYDLVDYYGGSWGGADAIAFATRHPEHVRSLVLDSPVGPPVVIPYTRRLRFETQAMPLLLDRLCARSLLCAPDHPNPSRELAELIEDVREHPMVGDSHDASGNLVHVKVDEAALLDFVLDDTVFQGNFTTKNEALAAYVSLEHGDAVPLLRLAAEGTFTADPTDQGDPTSFSVGAFYATGCSDVGEPWDWADRVADRMEDYGEHIAGLPQDYFAPFSKSAGRDTLFSLLGKQCFWWQKPTPSAPIATRHVVYPSVPTLVLAGDIDSRVPPAANEAVADLFPGSTFVTVSNSRHLTLFNTQCGVKLANQLIETLTVGDTSCANTPEYVWPAVGRFPLHANDARAATPDASGSNQISDAEQKVVSVAVATAIDALQRINVNGFGAGVGLRAGTFSTGFSADGNSAIVTLVNCAFSEDVTVNGTTTWSAFGDQSLAATLLVSGPATAGGTLQVSGFWNALGPLGYFKVTGSLGTKKVAVLVPEG